jgi:uncharacterized protein YegP (UPF0339 family)
VTSWIVPVVQKAKDDPRSHPNQNIPASSSIWRLKAANGNILADSGQGYSREQECLDDIERVKGSADAPVKEEKTG